MGINISTGTGRGIAGKIIPTGFGLLFTFMGLMFLRQEWHNRDEIKAMQAWAKTQGTIVLSKTEDDGEEYFGDRYDLMKVSSSGYDSKAEIVRRYPVGREISIFVNPADPNESVINRFTVYPKD